MPATAAGPSSRPRQRGARLLLALLSGALLAGAVTPGTAAADHLRCGDVVTESVTLDADLLRCPGAGLVIGADGITVDLDGHVIQGVRASFGNIGILNTGFDDVRIEDGTIREFVTGVSLGRTAPLPEEGEPGPAVSGNVLRRLELVDNRVGVELTRVHASALRRSVIRGGWEAGIVLRETTGVHLHRNVVERGYTGIRLDQSTTNTLVQGNRILDNDGAGIVVSGRYDGAFPPVGNLLVGNVADGNRTDGILVAGARATMLWRNRARRNGDDGIEVRCPDDRCPPGEATLFGNVTSHNADLGIEADEGTGDGGGNRARHNGTQPECVGVDCS